MQCCCCLHHPFVMSTFTHPQHWVASSQSLGGEDDDGAISPLRRRSYEYSCEELSVLLPCPDSSLPLFSLPLFPSTSSSSSPMTPYSFPVSPFLPPSPTSNQSWNRFDSPLSSTLSPLPTSPSPSISSSHTPPVPPSSKSVTEGDGECEGRGRKGKRKAMMGRPPSCNFCHISKVKCTPNSFPCHRCVRNNRGHLCKEWKSQQLAHSLLEESKPMDCRTVKRGRGKVVLADSSPSSIASSSSSESSLPPFPSLSSISSLSSSESHVLRLLLPHLPSPAFSLLSASSPDSSFEAAVSRCILRAVVPFQLVNPRPVLFPSIHIWLICRKMQCYMLEEDFETLRHTSRAVRLAKGEKKTEEEEENGRRERLSRYPSPFNEGFSRCKCLICVEVTSILRIHHSVYSFAASPLQPLPDLDYNNHPTLIIKRVPNCPGYAALMDRLKAHLGVEGGKPPAPVSSPFNIAYSVSVNRAFERLFAYTQAEMRRLFTKCEWKAPFVLFDRGEWERVAYHDMDEFIPPSQALMEERGWEARVKCVDKWSRSFECLIVRTFMFDDEGICNGMHTTFLATRKNIDPISNTVNSPHPDI